MKNDILLFLAFLFCGAIGLGLGWMIFGHPFAKKSAVFVLKDENIYWASEDKALDYYEANKSKVKKAWRCFKYDNDPIKDLLKYPL